MATRARGRSAVPTGREEAAAVRRYLAALEAARVPRKRGPKRTVESLERRLAALEAELATAKAVTRLLLVQERADLQEELESLRNTPDDELAAARADFVRLAAGYGERKGISYAAWREVGVDPATLREAGITR
ncbi:MAG: hypothetical protein AB7L84_16340 [Acidimicrobiia bacterium]